MSKSRSTRMANYQRAVGAQKLRTRKLQAQKMQEAAEQKPVKENPFQRIMRRIDEDNRQK